MTSRTSRTAALTAGAVALALGAYALGSQSGDGTADAAKRATRSTSSSQPGARRWRGGPDAGLAILATRLGVTSAALQAALSDLRLAGDPSSDDQLAAVAKNLKLDVAKLRAAIEKVRGSRPGPGRGDHRGPGGRGDDAAFAALAKELGVSAADLQAAFQKARDDAEAARLDDLAGTLAGPLGKDKADVAAALKKLQPTGKPTGRPGRGHRGPGDPAGLAAALAKELGVSTDKVTSAFDTLRKARDAEAQKRRDDFAAKLAAKLGISVDKVKQAFADPGPGRRGGRGRGAAPDRAWGRPA